MAKYNYDKKVLKGLSVGPFLSQVKKRTEEINKANDVIKPFDYNVNNIAKELHPESQFVIVKEIREEVEGKTFVFVPNEKKGTNELAYFRGDIRRCNNIITWKDDDGELHSTYVAIRGPVETKINSIQKGGISVDTPNYTLSILMPNNEYTMKKFQRYAKFYI